MKMAAVNHIYAFRFERKLYSRRLKYKLDRKSLETIYTALMVLFWNMATSSRITVLNTKGRNKKNQLEAARIATGATKLISVNNLYKETGWEP